MNFYIHVFVLLLGVLHEPELDPIVSPVADDGHRVVEVCGAWPGEDAAAVELEVVVSTVDGDRDWLVGHRLEQGGLAVGRHVLEPGDSDGAGGLLAGIAGAVGSLVGVVGLGSEASVL
ncbi:hypothetical protein HPP92_013588 [Vanilla planifolia]|nr:hypothetical protein HPP92_013588 [Vanilla planifolia]